MNEACTTKYTKTNPKTFNLRPTKMNCKANVQPKSISAADL